MRAEGFDYQHNISAGYYDRIHSRGCGVQSAWHQQKFRYVASRLPLSGSTLVDVGCGPGTFSMYVPAIYEYTGLDVSSPQIGYANRMYRRPGVQFRVMKHDDLEIPQASIDVVTAIELIEHLTSAQCDALLSN